MKNQPCKREKENAGDNASRSDTEAEALLALTIRELSIRQQKIINLMRQGMTQTQAAKVLGVSVSLISKERKAIQAAISQR